MAESLIIDRFHQAINISLKTLGKESLNLKEAQYEAIKAVVLDKKDTLAVLPTGYGKSLIYQCLPFVFEELDSTKSTVLVVSPLNALMQDQIEKLKDKVSCTVIKTNDAQSNLTCDCKLVFAHPEVFTSKYFSTSPLMKTLSKSVKAIVIDESHLVVEWKTFRPAYGKVSMLSSVFPHVPVLALTATATVAMKKNITESLGLCDPQVIAVNPDRQNIFFSSFLRKASGDDKLVEILQPLVKELRRERQDFPLTLIYGNLDTIAECYTYFSQSLGVEQYSEQNGEKGARNRLFTQFHAQYPEHERQRIVSELANGTSKLRILFVTVSFGIGIDIKNIRRVIHIGVPYTMEEYFQEAGRCGRDGLPAKAFIYYNAYDISKSKSQMSDVMREFVKLSNRCKREFILHYFGHPTPSRRMLQDHTCCDFHKSICQCDSCLMQDIEASQQALSLQESPVPSRSLDYRARSLSDNTKEKLHNALVDYRLSLHGSGPSCVGGLDLATGFSIELIDMIVEKAPQLHSLEDIKDNLPIFSNEHTEKIFTILQLHVKSLR